MKKEVILQYINDFPDGCDITFDLHELIPEEERGKIYPYPYNTRKFSITHGDIGYSDNIGSLCLEELDDR